MRFLVLALAAALITSPFASAETDDERFLELLERYDASTPFDDQNDVVRVGHAVCNDLRRGEESRASLAGTLAAGGVVNPYGFLTAATEVFCPEFLESTAPSPVPVPAAAPPRATHYPNCTAVRAAGAAPIYRGEPGYSSSLDRDGDGVACEK